MRVNAVAPAVVKTRFAGALYEGREAEVAAGYPAGRLGTPEDVGEAAAYLLGEERRAGSPGRRWSSTAAGSRSGAERAQLWPSTRASTSSGSSSSR